jgi:hypothetical protein
LSSAEDRRDERMGTALHEAGHTIAAEHLGFEPSALVLFGDSEAQSHGYGPPASEGTHETRAADDLVVTLAGEVALEVFGDPDPARGAFEDQVHAREVAFDLADGEPVRADALLVEARERATRLIRERYREVLLLAETLLVNHRLAGGELTTALEAAERDWPIPEFSVEGRYDFAVRQRELFEFTGDWERAAKLARAGARVLEGTEHAEGDDDLHNYWRETLASL